MATVVTTDFLAFKEDLSLTGAEEGGGGGEVIRGMVSSPITTTTLADGREAMCSISSMFRWRLLRASIDCLAFQSKMHRAKERKKQEKKAEKKTRRSMFIWSCRMMIDPNVSGFMPCRIKYSLGGLAACTPSGMSRTSRCRTFLTNKKLSRSPKRMKLTRPLALTLW